MNALLAILFASLTAQASISVDCGFARKSAEDKLERYFLLTTPYSKFSGSAGSGWHLYDFLGQEIFKGELSENALGNIEIFLPNFLAPDPYGMGTTYEIERPYGERMVKATQRVKDWFNGESITGRLECLVHNH